MADPKDQIKYVFNPITGQLDAVLQFNPDRIVTASLNAAGQPRLIWDPVSQSYIEDGATVVVDSEGNVVVN